MCLDHVTIIHSCGNELGYEGYQVAQEWLCMEGWWYWQWHYVINCTWQFREVDWTFNYLLLNKRGDQLLQLHLDMEGRKEGREREKQKEREREREKKQRIIRRRDQDTISLHTDEKSTTNLKYPIRIWAKKYNDPCMLLLCSHIHTQYITTL